MDKKRPAALTAIAIVGIVLGSLGTCGGLLGTGSLLLQDQMQAFSQQMAEMSSANDHIYQQQMAMQEQLRGLADAWLPALIALQIVNLLGSIALLVGGIALVRWKPSGPRLFAGAALAGLAIDAGAGAITILYQLEVNAIMQDYLTGLVSDPMLAGAEQSMNAIGQASSQASMFFGAAWIAVKLGFYVFSIIRLRKPDVRALFAPSPA